MVDLGRGWRLSARRGGGHRRRAVLLAAAVLIAELPLIMSAEIAAANPPAGVDLAGEVFLDAGPLPSGGVLADSDVVVSIGAYDLLPHEAWSGTDLTLTVAVSSGATVVGVDDAGTGYCSVVDAVTVSCSPNVLEDWFDPPDEDETAVFVDSFSAYVTVHTAGTGTLEMTASVSAGGVLCNYAPECDPVEHVVGNTDPDPSNDVALLSHAIEGTTASLGDRVWDDLNGDGVQDAGEPGLDGVTVHLLDNVGATLDTTVSASGGAYAFADLDPGSYRVQVVSPPGRAVTLQDMGGDDATDNDVSPAAATSDLVTLLAGQSVTDLDIGLLSRVGISGSVYDDLNDDGVRDVGEPGIAGAEVTLQGITDLGDLATTISVSDGTGAFGFSNQRPGTYSLAEEQPAGWDDGLDAAGTAGGVVGNDVISGIVLGAGAQASGYTFGESWPNDAPTGDAQSVTVAEEGTVAVTLTGSDPDGDGLAFVLESGPSNGSLSGTIPALAYTPDPDYVGADSFTFVVNDGDLDSTPATVTVDVTPVNDVPIASGASVTTPEATPLPIVLSASDVDGDVLDFDIVAWPTRGTFTGDGANRTYTPNPFFVGTDTFTFRARDASEVSSVVTVTITVLEIDDPPIAGTPGQITSEDTAVHILLGGIDPEGDPLDFAQVSPPANGTLTWSPPAVLYTPDLDYSGIDSFTYEVSDGTSTSNVATVFIAVGAANDAPVATAQNLVVEEDGTLPITFTGTDADGDTLVFSLVDTAQHGSFTGAEESWTYVPEPGFTGTDQVTFAASDSFADSPVASIAIVVSPGNAAPQATSGASTTPEDEPVAFMLAGTDPDGDALDFVVDDPDHGTLSGTEPDLLYTPDPDFAGVDSLSFVVNDGALDSAPETYEFTVTARNDAPTANGQSVTVAEDGSVAVTLTGDDPESAELKFVVSGQPGNGTLTGDASSLAYEPAADFSGTDTFTFTVSDGALTSATATVSIDVTAVNDLPVAKELQVALTEDRTLAVTLAGSDRDGDLLTYEVTSGPADGTLSGAPSSLIYTPDANFVGVDTFTYTAYDGTGLSAPAEVMMTVHPANDRPVALPQVVTVPEDTAWPVVLTGLDIDGDQLRFEVVGLPSRGTLTGDAQNRVYTPDPNANGPDQLTFLVDDGKLESSLGTVTVSVTPANDPPVASSRGVSTSADTLVAVALGGYDPDGGSVAFVLVDGPDNGDLGGSEAARTYTPDPGFSGDDSFTFVTNDGALDSPLATVIVHVGAVNHPPVATSASVTVQEDTGEPIVLVASDPDGDPLQYEFVKPAHGTVTGVAANLTYSPDPDYSGTDAITFSVMDGSRAASTGTVSIDVVPVNDPPTAELVQGAANEDNKATVTLVGSDPEDDPLTFSIASDPANGSVALVGSTVTYAPDANFNGTDEFTYRANDGTDDSAPATARITIRPINDAPVASSPARTAVEDTPADFPLLAVDPEGDTVTCFVDRAPFHGAADHSPGAMMVTYRPDLHYVGADSLLYRCTDGGATSPPTLLSITVTPVNDAPSALDAVASTAEDTFISLPLNVSDPDSTSFQVTAAQPLHGTTTVSGNRVNYKPDLDYHGPDSFTYSVGDGTSFSNTATVSLTVVPANDAPRIVFWKSPSRLAEGQPYSGYVVIVDPDVDDVGRFRMTCTGCTSKPIASTAFTVSAAVCPPWVTPTAGYCVSMPLQFLQPRFGSFPATVTVTDAAGATHSLTRSVQVTDAKIYVEMVDSLAKSSTGADIACILDENAQFGSAADLTATIHWGDGTPVSTGTVVKDYSGECGTEDVPAFRVLGTHTYATTGTKTVTVTVKSAGVSSSVKASRSYVISAPTVRVYGRRRYGR